MNPGNPSLDQMFWVVVLPSSSDQYYVPSVKHWLISAAPGRPTNAEPVQAVKPYGSDKEYAFTRQKH